MIPCWWERGLNPGDFDIPASWPPKRPAKKSRASRAKKERGFRAGDVAKKRAWMQKAYRLWESVDPFLLRSERREKASMAAPKEMSRKLDGGWLRILTSKDKDERKRPWPPFDPQGVPLLSYYDKIVLAFSGGKDSLACLLYLMEIANQQGFDLGPTLEIHHHLIDGVQWYDKEHGGGTDWTMGMPEAVWDWPSTENYCIAVVEALGLGDNLRFSWRMGGFVGQIFKLNVPVAPVAWESDIITPEGARKIKKSQPGGERKSRMMFPAPVADLQKRWCSSSLKIEALSRQITNEPKYQNARTLVITGERAEESPARASYYAFQSGEGDLWAGRTPRVVDHWRPVLLWPKEMVWDIIAAYRIDPHICYKLGFGRCSCQFCIFSSPSQWKTNSVISPERFNMIAYWEYQLTDWWQQNYKREGKKRPWPAIIDMNKITVIEKANDPSAGVYPLASSRELVSAANDAEYSYNPILKKWSAPAGYNGEDTGPN